MKKLFVLLFCLFAWGASPIYAIGDPIDLGLQIIDDNPTNPGKGKAPMRMPRIYQDGYTLTLSSFHPEYIINIMQGDDIVFTSVIPAGVTEYELPAYLNGSYTIQFINGRYCFTGYINF